MKNFYRDTEIEQLVELISNHPRLFLITGAGVSCASGIPDYRDQRGEWKRPPPIMHQEFIQSEATRKRYWARSLVGWRWFGTAEPNRNHQALRQLEAMDLVQRLVTQNVDGLHQRAGSKRVIDLHGCIDRILCLTCRQESLRADFQHLLEQRNPDFVTLTAERAPDGDADLDDIDFSGFDVPACNACGGDYMPKVVFYGGAVPKQRIADCYADLAQSQAVLVIGSSLMVYSVYQFCRYASNHRIPVLAVNRGKTRHDGHYRLKLESDCEEVLDELVAQLSQRMDYSCSHSSG